MASTPATAMIAEKGCNGYMSDHSTHGRFSSDSESFLNENNCPQRARQVHLARFHLCVSEVFWQFGVIASGAMQT